MEIEESNIGRDDQDDDLDLLLIVAQCITNNNVALIQYLRRRRRRKQQHFLRLRAVLQILLPPDHRHLPRRQKAIFRHREAFFVSKGTTLESLVI